MSYDNTASFQSSSRSWPAVALVMMSFFTISFMSNVIGAVLPAWVSSFDINLVLAGFLPLSFFLAYFVWSIPVGLAAQRFGEKRVMITAFLLAASAAAILCLWPSFVMAMVCLFAMGSAMAALQVVINPLLRVAGGEAHFAFNSVLAQLLFGFAGSLSPKVFQWFDSQLKGPAANSWLAWVPESMPWLAMYGLFVLLCLGLLVLVCATRLPKIERQATESIESWTVLRALWRQPKVKMYFLGIFAYVALEQGIANSLSLFLQQAHGFDPMVTGAQVVSDFWLMLTLGCILSLGLLKVFDTRVLLQSFSLLAATMLALGLYGGAMVSQWALPMTAFFLSLMWSAIFSLALNSVPLHQGALAGILCSGIVGGALISPVIGLVAELTGDIRVGLWLMFGLLAYLFALARKAKPLISNSRFRGFGFARVEENLD